ASLFTLLIQFSPRSGVAPTPLAPAPAATISATATPASSATTGASPTVTQRLRKKLPGPWRIGAASSGQKRIDGQIGQEPFLKAIQTAGIDKTQAYRIYTALKDEKNLDR